MSHDLEGKTIGKTILVTGGGAGIGRAIAKHCYDCGATVAVGSLKSRLSFPERDRIHVSEVDVRQPESIDNGVANVANRTARIDGLMANAGDTLPSTFLQTPIEELEMLWQTNLRNRL